MSYWKYMCKPRNHGNLPLFFSLHANRIPYRVISQLHPEELSPSIGQLFYIHFFFWCCLNGTSLLHLHVYKWNHDTFLLWAEKLLSFFFLFLASFRHRKYIGIVAARHAATEATKYIRCYGSKIESTIDINRWAVRLTTNQMDVSFVWHHLTPHAVHSMNLIINGIRKVKLATMRWNKKNHIFFFVAHLRSAKKDLVGGRRRK